MKKLKAQRVAEIATKTEVLATEKSNNEEKRTTVDLLNKEIDAVYVEAAQGSGTK